MTCLLPDIRPAGVEVSRGQARIPGAIGGSGSQEFHVLADSGEDAIAFCPDSDYAANIEMAESLPPAETRGAADGLMQKIKTPGKKTCEEVAEFLKLPIEQTVKTLAVVANGEMYLLLLRGDHHLNETKVRKISFLVRFQARKRGRNTRAHRLPSRGISGLSACSFLS